MRELFEGRLSFTRTHRVSRSVRLTLITCLIGGAYAISVRKTDIDVSTFVTGIPSGLELIRDFVTPDVFVHESVRSSAEFTFPVPCGAASLAVLPDRGPRVVPQVPCAAVGDEIVVEGVDLRPDSKVKLFWILQDKPDQRLHAASVTVDKAGYFQTEIEVRPLVAADAGAASKLRAEISFEEGGIHPSPALRETVDATVLTLFMALIATSLAAVVAVPISFLGASNIMRRGRMARAIYQTTRLFLNITRTFEPLVLATIFGLWVGFGPFAGVLALTVFTIGSLGKMFSEAVESIDPGPVEAVAATGASYMEQVLYAVVPQIMPGYTSYTVYHWDINVRISTIIGFVGGGGIGHLLNQRLKMFAYHQAGTALWAIVLVVWLLDFFSAEIRKRVT